MSTRRALVASKTWQDPGAELGSLTVQMIPPAELALECKFSYF